MSCLFCMLQIIAVLSVFFVSNNHLDTNTAVIADWRQSGFIITVIPNLLFLWIIFERNLQISPFYSNVYTYLWSKICKKGPLLCNTLSSADKNKHHCGVRNCGEVCAPLLAAHFYFILILLYIRQSVSVNASIMGLVGPKHKQFLF